MLIFFVYKTETYDEPQQAYKDQIQNILNDEEFKENYNELKEVLNDQFMSKLKHLIYLRKKLKTISQDNSEEYNEFKKQLESEDPDDREALCNTCHWKLKKSCNVYDEKSKKGSPTWNPKCLGNNDQNGLICTFRNTKYEYDCAKYCGDNLGQCNSKNKELIYKQIGVPKCIYKSSKKNK